MPPASPLPALIVRVAQQVPSAYAGSWVSLPLVLTRPAGAAGAVRLVNIGCTEGDVQLDLDLFQLDLLVRPGETYRLTLPILVPHPRELDLGAFYIEVSDPPELVSFPSQLLAVGPSLAREIVLQAEPVCAYESGTKVRLSWQHQGATSFEDFAVNLGPEGALVAGKTAYRHGSFQPGDRDEAEVIVQGAALEVVQMATTPAGRTQARQTIAILPPSSLPQRPLFRFLAPRRLASDQITIHQAKTGDLVPVVDGFVPVHAGQDYLVTIRPSSPHVQALHLRDIPGRIVVRKPDGEREGQAWTFPIEITVPPNELFSRPERLDYTIESEAGPMAGEVHLKVKPPRGKHISLAAAFGLALTAQGLFAFGRMMLQTSFSLELALRDFQVARDYPVFLSLTIPSIWAGLSLLDWLSWRLRD